MKRNVLGIFLVIIIFFAFAPQMAKAAETETGAQKADRTVLLYACGADLETGSGMCTYNLKQVLGANFSKDEKVKFVVMTGGSEKWFLDGDYLVDPNNIGLTIDSKTGKPIISNVYNQIWEARGMDAAENPGKLVLLDADGITGDGAAAVKSKKELMSDPKTLQGFIDYGVTKYPAEKYDLILWDHGAGPSEGFAVDEHDPEMRFMPFAKILDVFANNKAVDTDGDGKPDNKFDFVDFDACLMSSAEIDLAVADYTDYYIASPETEPGYGQDYTGWLNMLGQDPNMETFELGKKIVDDFIAFYDKPEGDGSMQEGTLAIIDTKKLLESGLADKLTELSQSMKRESSEPDADSGELLFYDELLSVKSSIQYGGEAYYDLGNLASLIGTVQTEVSEQEIQDGNISFTNRYTQTARKISEILQDQDMIYARGTKGINKQDVFYMDTNGEIQFGPLYTSGMYIFFPTPKYPRSAKKYVDAMAETIKRIPEGDPFGRDSFMKNHMQAVIDYSLIAMTGQEVDELSFTGTKKESISFASLKRGWDPKVEGGSWLGFYKPLMTARSGGKAAAQTWLDTVIRQQAKESISIDNITVEKKENGDYRFTITDSRKRMLDTLAMDLIAELPEERITNLGETAQEMMKDVPGALDLSIGTIEGEPYLDLSQFTIDDPEVFFREIIEWMNNTDSQWDIKAWDNKWYAVEDADGRYHAACTEVSDKGKRVRCAYEQTSNPFRPLMADLFFDEDNNLTEIGFINDTGYRPVMAKDLTEEFTFVPLQTIDRGFMLVNIPISTASFKVSAENADQIRLVYTNTNNISDIKDIDGDGQSVNPNIVINDIYGSRLTITDLIKENNTLKASGRTVKIKAKALKKKSMTIVRKKAFKVSNAKGDVSYELTGVSKPKYKKSFKVDLTTGKITVKKGLKKGVYKLRVKVHAEGNAAYKAMTRKVTVTVRVR